MEISAFLYISFMASLSFLYTIHGFEPSMAPSVVSLAPDSGGTLGPATGDNNLSSPSPAPKKGGEADMAPAPEIGSTSSHTQEAEEGGVQMVSWCTLSQHYEDCQSLVSVLDQSHNYTWKCIQKDTIQDCLDSIKNGESDLINLEAGLAYTAFLNYSMKAIANEVYCDHSKSYQAVAVVHRKACQQNNAVLGLIDFKGRKSCNGGYFTASGWNYPINGIRESLGSKKATEFFPEICAPSGIKGSGICGGCGHDNGTCDENSPYFGESGAFRCLVEEVGDIAFVKADTVLHYSIEGPLNQSWSTKSVRDFMYLCPQGGCREINDYPGSCSFGSVPANVIMASNSLPNKKRLSILLTMTNSTLMEALHSRKYDATPLLSPGTQGIAVVKKLTRTYLGMSAIISQSIQQLYTQDNQTANTVSDLASQACSWGQNSLLIIFSVLTMYWLLFFTSL
ncbi:hypothetical protein HRI_001548000 [Hibiscus trionum]|uniref:Transferrin-like domain-containing protein n=1 Tax=Hibiscus trionum TaxID=183268 RepID=A0A9W7HK00_HIBTR|nr:hypothetical protein HRI_001548000 [Hibiscus trionum]